MDLSIIKKDEKKMTKNHYVPRAINRILVNAKINQLREKVKEIFGIEIAEIEIRYDVKGRVAGYAYTAITNPYIRLNGQLLDKYNDEFINDTVVHEFTHIATNLIFNMNCGHNKNFYYVGEKLGYNLTRCHNFEVEKARSVSRDYIYQAECNCQFSLTSILHKRIQNGQIRKCSKHGGKITKDNWIA